jgi:hypothetical protein
MSLLVGIERDGGPLPRPYKVVVWVQASSLLLPLVRPNSAIAALDPLAMINGIKPKILLHVGERACVNSSNGYVVPFLRVARLPLKTGTRATEIRNTGSR